MKIKDLQEINDNKLNSYIKQGTKNDLNISREIEIHKRIKNLFEKYEALFFQISMDDALTILSKLVPKKDIEKVYAELISIDNYNDLKKKNNK